MRATPQHHSDGLRTILVQSNIRLRQDDAQDPVLRCYGATGIFQCLLENDFSSAGE